MKTCPTCGGGFEPNRAWQRFCSTKCQRNRAEVRASTRLRQSKRRELINTIKVERGCSECGYNAHPSALDFNHVRGEKLFNISQDVKRRWSLILEEIEKCEVLCANCHRIHTYENRHWQTKRKAS